MPENIRAGFATAPDQVAVLDHQVDVAVAITFGLLPQFERFGTRTLAEPDDLVDERDGTIEVALLDNACPDHRLSDVEQRSEIERVNVNVLGYRTTGH